MTWIDLKNANIELSVDLSSYATTATTYTKTEVNNSLSLKSNQSTTYNKAEVDTLIANIPLSSYYTQTQLDTLFSTYHLKTEVDTLLSSKQDSVSTASGEAGVKPFTIKQYYQTLVLS